MTTVSRQTSLADLPDLLRVPEVAAYADVGASTVRAAIGRHELRAVRLGRLLRVPREELVAWIGRRASDA